jgi:hypothetical protein
MKKCSITITPFLKNKPIPTVVIDIFADDVSVNYPKNAGININSSRGPSHFELCVKIPQTDKELHFRYDNCYMHELSNKPELTSLKRTAL